jgi:hypothetical protein
MLKKVIQMVVIFSCLSLSNIVSAAETFTLTNAQKGMCLDAKGYSAKKRTSVQLYHCDGYDDQRWYFANEFGQPVSLSQARLGYYNIRNVKSNLCLDAKGHTGSKDDSVIIYTCEPPSYRSEDQTWKLEAWPGNAGNVLNGAKNRCLDVGGTSGGAGANVQLWTCEGYEDQFWTVTDIEYN